jgi:trigger factor
MPTISRQDLSPSHLHLTITVTREDLRPKLDSEFKKLKQRATIKGFRPGQAPAQYVKSLYGSSLFYDVFNKMMSEELYGYMRDQQLDVLGQPLPVEEDRKYTFKFDNPEPEYALTYEIGHVPKFELVGLDKEQTYERYAISNIEALASQDLEEARKRGGKRITPEDDILEDDIIRVASKEMDGDQPKEGGWETTITVFVKSISNADLKQQILGLKKGATIRFDVTQLEEERDEAFIRKYMLNLPEDDDRAVGNIFEGEIIEVTRMAAADLDEEFFQANFGGSVSSEGEAIEELKKGIEQFYENRANALVFREMQDRLLQLNNIELPEAFLKRWLKLSNEGVLSDAEVEKDYENFATSLRWSMLRDKMLAKYEITVSDDEIREEFYRTLMSYFRAQLPFDMLKGGVDRMMQDKKEVERVQSNIEYEKMFSAAIADVTIQPKTITSEEFHEIFDSARKKVEEGA